MCKVCEQAKKLEECASKIPIGMAFTKDGRRAKQAAKIITMLDFQCKIYLQKGIELQDIHSQFKRLCTQLREEIKTNLDYFEEEQQKQMNGTSNENRSEQPKSRRNRTAKMNEKRNHRDYFTGISTDVLDPLPIEYSLMRTEFRYISTKNELLNLSSQLKNVKIFAFDLERTIPGIYGGRDQICLIQISTRDCDFIIDTLRIEVHRQIHALLGDLFSNQNILKVVHGHDDQNWLVREFGIKIVNIYDTSSHGNLISLVYEACGVKLEKKFQTANWAKRPLPNEMITYARLDSHYLIPCYDYLQKKYAKWNN